MELVQFTNISLYSLIFDNSHVDFNTNSSKYQFILKYLFFLVLPFIGYIRQGKQTDWAQNCQIFLFPSV